MSLLEELMLSLQDKFTLEMRLAEEQLQRQQHDCAEERRHDHEALQERARQPQRKNDERQLHWVAEQKLFMEQLRRRRRCSARQRGGRKGAGRAGGEPSGGAGGAPTQR